MKNQIDDISALTTILLFLTIVLVLFGAYPIFTSKEGFCIAAVYVCSSIVFGLIIALIIGNWLKKANKEQSLIEKNGQQNIEHWDLQKFWVGIIFALLGAMGIFLVPFTEVNIWKSIVLTLGAGLYFTGCNVLVQSRFSQKRDFQNLSNQIADLKKILEDQK
jgi:predicted tellurium resistance membrane protein TerC